MKTLALWLSTLLITGCAALPSQVKFPPSSAKLDPAQALQADVQDTAIPKITSADFGADQAELFARTWREADRNLLLQRDILNNGQFGMAVAGAYNTVKGNLTAAKWALAGAGGIGLVLDRYQVEAQALAYRQGAQSMECVRREVQGVPTSVWKQFDLNGDFAMDAQELDKTLGEDKAKEAYEALGGLLLSIHDVLSEVANKVYDNVSSKTVRVPKADDIIQAAKDQQVAQPDVKEKAGALAKARAGGAESLQRIGQLRALIDENERELSPLSTELQQFQRNAPEVAALASGPALGAARSPKPPSAETKQRVEAYARLQDDVKRKLVHREELTRQLQRMEGGLTMLVMPAPGAPFPTSKALEAALNLPGKLKSCVASEVP